MAFNISDFRANATGAGSRGVSKQAHFELVISLPRKISLSDRSILSSVIILVMTISDVIRA